MKRIEQIQEDHMKNIGPVSDIEWLLFDRLNEVIAHLQGQGESNAQPAQDDLKCKRCNGHTVLCKSCECGQLEVVAEKGRDCGGLVMVHRTFVDGQQYFLPPLKDGDVVQVYRKTPNSDEGNGS